MLVRRAVSTCVSSFNETISTGMILDWREMAGRPTVRGMQGEERWSSYTGAWSGGKKVGYSWQEDQLMLAGRTDPMRGWIIAFCWMLASGAECVLNHRSSSRYS